MLSLALAAAAISFVVWPGQTDPDTLDEVQEAATGHFLSWHAPLLSALWRVPYLLGLHSTGWLLFLSLFTLLVGLYLVLRVRFSRVVSTIVAVLCCLYPPVLSWSIHVGHDAWFTALVVCAFGFLARARRLTGRSRMTSRVVATALVFLASASRANAIIAVVVFFLVLAAEVLPSHVRRRTLMIAAVGVGATVAVFGAQRVASWALGVKQVHPEQDTMIYDLAHMSKIEGKDLFPRSIDARLSISRIDRVTTPEGNNSLIYGGEGFPRTVERGALQELQNAWVSAIVHDPPAYLKERGTAALYLLGIGHSPYWVFQNESDSSYAHPGATHVAIDYLATFTYGGNLYGDALFEPWIYFLLGGLSVFVLRRRGKPEKIVAWLSVAMIVYGLASIFLVPELLYRDLYPMVVVGTVVTPVMLPRGVRGALADRLTRSRRSDVEHDVVKVDEHSSEDQFRTGTFVHAAPVLA